MVPNFATNGANIAHVKNGDAFAENIVCALVSWMDFCGCSTKGMLVGVWQECSSQLATVQVAFVRGKALVDE